MFVHGERVEQDVELRAQTHGPPHPLHIRPYRVTVDGGVPRTCRQEPGQHGHGGGLAGAVVAQQHEYFVGKYFEGQVSHRPHFVVAEGLFEV